MTTTTATTTESVPAAEDTPAVRRRRRRGLAPGKRLPASRLIGPALFLVLWAAASAAGRLDPARSRRPGRS